MLLPLSFGADIISVPFVVLMNWKQDMHLFSSLGFREARLPRFAHQEARSATAVPSLLAGLPLCRRTGGEGFSYCLRPSVRWSRQASSSLTFPFPALLVLWFSFFCHGHLLWDDELQMPTPHYVTAVSFSQSLFLEQGAESVSSKPFIHYLWC